VAANLSAAAAEAAASLCASADDDGKRFVGGSLPAIATASLRYNLLRHIRDSVINRSDLLHPIER